ncbi:MAG: hypothetical protein ACI4KK_00315, partial [Lentihominibacter sp.]
SYKCISEIPGIFSENVICCIKSHLTQDKPVMIWAHTNNTKWGANSNQVMLLIGMDEDGNAIMVDPVDRDWSDDDQRLTDRYNTSERSTNR